MQAAPIEGFATRVAVTTDLASAAGGARRRARRPRGGGEWQGDEALLLLKRLRADRGRRASSCAPARRSASSSSAASRELGFARARLFGSAPEALAGGARALVALEANGSPRDVALTVLGVPPAQIVVPWDDATIGGFAADRVLDEPARRRLAARVAPLWPPGPTRSRRRRRRPSRSIWRPSRRTISCFVAPDDSTGRRSQRGRAAGPARPRWHRRRRCCRR